LSSATIAALRASASLDAEPDSETDNMAETYIAAYITAKNADEARRIGRALVECRLAACANVFDGMQSIYRWNDAIVEDNEAVLIAKTRASLFDALAAKTKSLHSYDNPCIIALPVVDGSPEYFAWLDAQTAPQSD
jgi:periplasmic divalent cation tolerance protein